MKIINKSLSNLFLLAFLLLAFGACMGVFAACNYIWPVWFRNNIDFTQLRPLHVSLVLFWILLGASVSLLYVLNQESKTKLIAHASAIQLVLWLSAIGGIVWAYFNHQFGGREYWEFPPFISILLALAWIINIYVFFSIALKIKKWPVYMWMWMTGLVFFLFIFTENYLWLFPSFRADFIKDTLIQWKVNGSIVGSWNQLIYGLSLYLMAKISGDDSYARSPLAFAMYFLGLFNLMFNWSHHIYTLPTEKFIRYVGYFVSMTEWIILIRIFYTWNKNLTESKKHAHLFSYRLLFAADIWVCLNLILALFMSIPGVNLYTHGTHITVAHAMGTTIGINTMILLATVWYFSEKYHAIETTWDKRFYYILQWSLLIFWLVLIIAGIQKGIWQMSTERLSFREMMALLKPWFILLLVSGISLALSLVYFSIRLIKRYRLMFQVK